MKQNIFIAALLAGMLVLAGCGGGSSSNQTDTNTDMMDTDTDDTTMMDSDDTDTEPTPTTLALPGTATIDGGGTTAGGYRGDYDIKAGENKEIGDVYFECAEGGADCVVTVGSGRNLNSVTYTGGTVRATATNPTVTAQTIQPTVDDADAMQVNAASIEAAIEGRGTIHGFGLASGDDTLTSGAIDGRQPFPHQNDQETILFLDSTGITGTAGTARRTENYIFWGHWTKGKVDANEILNAGTGISRIQPNLVWGGNFPYGVKPDLPISHK